jgi:hypothetical protein
MQSLQAELAHLGIADLAHVQAFGFRQVYNPNLNVPPELRTYVNVRNPLRGDYATRHFDGLQVYLFARATALWFGTAFHSLEMFYLWLRTRLETYQLRDLLDWDAHIYNQKLAIIEDEMLPIHGAFVPVVQEVSFVYEDLIWYLDVTIVYWFEKATVRTYYIRTSLSSLSRATYRISVVDTNE